MINSVLSKKKPVVSFIALRNHYSLGIRTISSLLKSNDFDVNIIFLGNYYDPDHYVLKEKELLSDLLKSLETDVAGISVNTPFFSLATDITRQILKPLMIHSIWGGVHPTILPEECIQIADIICIGQGEYACLELANCLNGKNKFEGIQNLWVRGKTEIHRNSLRPLLDGSALDALPYPDYGSDDMYYINKNKVIKGDPFLNSIQYEIIASRGCPFTCSYCINSILRDIYPKGSKYIRRSPENIVNEIELARKVFKNFEVIRFEDEVFPWEREWLTELCRIYKQRVNLPFVCTYNPNLINEERIRLLKEAGLTSMGLGLQSPAEGVRKNVFNRNESAEQLLESLRILHKYDIEITFDLIFKNPYETVADKKEGLDFLLKLQKPFCLSTCSLKFFPEVTLTKKALCDGLISEKDIKKGGGLTICYDLKGDKNLEDVFWNCLFILASRSCVPRSFVRYLRNSSLMQKSPNMLVMVVTTSKLVEILLIALRRLRKGQLNFSILRRSLKLRVIKQIFS